ncbi:MAG TPA: DUF3618 domain-containing protein [Pyrinomonadaceae bacterium]|jgi:ElaB/YqjD/DUF883 family membrane-anchored ribosome-binding protein|nr:DUF3618 domain-containing protein [Pyrinomonadaceae bacterium]
MDQRASQLNDEDWIEDRGATLSPDDEGMIASETVAFVELDSDDAETERIKADIEDTRAELGQTLNEIQERLSPEHVMDQVKETVREATIGKVERVMERVNEKISNVTEPAMEAMGRAGEKLKETGSSVGNVIWQNPIPFALIGLGAGMLVMHRVRNADSRTMRSYRQPSDREMEYGMATPRYRGTGRQLEGSSGEYAGGARQYGASNRGAFSQMKETASGVMHGATERVSNLSHEAKEGALYAGRTVGRLVKENPLAVSAVALAVGAAVGLALPSTQMEKEYMGEASEKVVDKAQQVARDAMDKVKSATKPDDPKPPQPPQPTPTA